MRARSCRAEFGDAAKTRGCDAGSELRCGLGAAYGETRRSKEGGVRPGGGGGGGKRDRWNFKKNHPGVYYLHWMQAGLVDRQQTTAVYRCPTAIVESFRTFNLPNLDQLTYETCVSRSSGHLKTFKNIPEFINHMGTNFNS